MGSVRKSIEFLEKVWMAIAVLALLSMMFSISLDAFGRYIFGSPLAGNFEYTSYFAMVVLAFMAQSRTYALGGHVKLVLFGDYLGRVPFRLSDRLNTVLAAAVFALITWYAGIDALEKIEARETTFGVVQFPVYFSFLWFPLGCGLLTVRLVFDTFYPPAPSSQTL